MISQELVSVIIACHNGEKYIGGCLESLKKSTHSNYEIIICDDASTDDSYEILLRYSKEDDRIKILKNDTNMYAAYSRNKCLDECKGDYIMIQDIDDFSAEDRMEKLIDAIKSYNVDFASSAVYCFESEPDEYNSIIYPKKLRPSKYDFLWNLPFHHPATMFTKSCLISVGGYRVSQETRRGQDYDMFMRMYSKGFKGINIPEPLYYFRVDRSNILRRSWSARKDEMKIRIYGFKSLGLMPLGYIFVIKPIFAHIVQRIKYRKMLG